MNNAAQNANLDILRSLAVLSVLACHLMQVVAGCKFGEHYAFGIDTYALGQAGVLIFFVHTSLVLMQSLERTRTRPSPWALARNFYIRRAFRIYPLSISAILLAVAFSIPPHPLGVAYQWRGAKWFLSNILLIQNAGNIGSVSSPLWSLPYEVQMYLILPVVFLQVRSPKSGARLAQLYLVSVLFSRLFPLLRFAPCFLAGVIAYRLLPAVRPRIPSWLWAPAILLAVAAYVSKLYPYESWLKDLVVCLVIGVWIPLFRRSQGTLAAVAARIAKYSYGIYLCHMPLLWLFYRKLEMPDGQRAFWLAIAMCVVPVLCYHAIEQPLIRMGTRLAQQSTQTDAGPAIAATIPA